MDVDTAINEIFKTIWLLLSLVITFFVYYDATKHKIGKIPNYEGFIINLNRHAGEWALLTLLFWPVILPIYLYKRNSLIQKAKELPQSSRRVIGLGFIVFLLGLGLAGLAMRLIHLGMLIERTPL